jgi:hypothetical protein
LSGFWNNAFASAGGTGGGVVAFVSTDAPPSHPTRVQVRKAAPRRTIEDFNTRKAPFQFE